MTVNDLPTVGYLDQWFRAIEARLPAAPAAAGSAAAGAGEAVLYTVAGLAQVLSVDVNTVRRWIKTGKPNPHDPHNRAANVRLTAIYGTSEARISWPAFLAYERGEPYDKAATPAPTAAPPPVGLAPAEPPRLRKVA